VTTTRRTLYRDASGAGEIPSPGPSSPELQARISCKGRTAGLVLGDVRRALSTAAARQRDPLVVLEDLGLLRDSVATLIKELSRLLVGYPRTVTFWEASGYTEAFVSVMEKKATSGMGLSLEPTPRPAGIAEPAPRPIVVCVDDELPILSAIARLARRESYELRTTTDPEQALDWVRTEKVALVIADYRMPRMSGTTLLQLTKACSPGTARMLLTGYAGESIVIAAAEAGLLNILAKPWDDEALRERIRGVLAGAQDLGGAPDSSE
jgi:CheY-like chemotaxis protein